MTVPSVPAESAENSVQSSTCEAATEDSSRATRFRPLAGAFAESIAHGLSDLDARGLRRSTRAADSRSENDLKNGPLGPLVNLIGNDALGIGADLEGAQAFLETVPDTLFRFSASASRVLSGSSAAHDTLEAELARRYGRPDGVLLFQSGWHANSGLLAALTRAAPHKTAILLDREIHASFIDGMTLARAQGATVQRFAHNDVTHLEHFVEKFSETHDAVVIVTESLFSMGGDTAPLRELAELRERHPKTILVVDEAHAFAAYGRTGLGLAEAEGVLDAIDVVIGTFGKATGTAGAFVATTAELRAWFASTHRPSIYSTALPPLLVARTLDVVRNLETYAPKRERLHALSARVRKVLGLTGPVTHIIPIPLGTVERATAAARALRDAGFEVGLVRPPTVRIPGLRVSLNASLTDEEAMRLTDVLSEVLGTLNESEAREDN